MSGVPPAETKGHCNQHGRTKLEKRTQDCHDPNCIDHHGRVHATFPEDTAGSEVSWDVMPDGHEHNMHRPGGVRNNERFSVSVTAVACPKFQR